MKHAIPMLALTRALGYARPSSATSSTRRRPIFNALSGAQLYSSSANSSFSRRAARSPMRVVSDSDVEMARSSWSPSLRE